MQTWLMTNPKSGSGERNEDFWAEHLRQAGFSQWRHCTLDETCEDSGIDAGDLVLVAGGDGSVNRAASLCLERDAILGVLPSGTANDFARQLGLPDDPAELCRLLYRMPTLRVDVSWLNGRLYLNVAHVGLGSFAARDARHQTKRWLGRFSYAASLFRRLWVHRGFHADIQGDHARVSGRWLSIAIANGVFFGGGGQIPEGAIDDGCLDIVAVRPRSRVRLLAAFVAVNLLRRSRPDPSTLVHIKSSWCRVRSRRPKPVSADGELIGRTPLDVRCEPRALQVVSEGLVRPQ